METCVQFKEQIHENSGFRFDLDKVKGGHQETMQSYLVVEKCREQGFSELLTPIVNGPKEAKDLQHLTLCVIIMLILWNCLRCLQRAMQRMKLLQRMMQMIDEERTQSNLNCFTIIFDLLRMFECISIIIIALAIQLLSIVTIKRGGKRRAKHHCTGIM